jgi:hypothetical protein|tara:strand:+ start:3275 stop:3454 length:180 start_codon:yes stop_codon:yes gene_type:complete
MTLEDINNKLNNVLIDLKANQQMLYDLLRNLGVDINAYRETYTENYSDDSEKELSNYRL